MTLLEIIINKIGALLGVIITSILIHHILTNGLNKFKVKERVFKPNKLIYKILTILFNFIIVIFTLLLLLISTQSFFQNF